MPDGTENSSGHPSDQGRSSDGGQNPSQPQSFTRDQVDKLLNERHGKLDRQIADLTKERDGSEWAGGPAPAGAHSRALDSLGGAGRFKIEDL